MGIISITHQAKNQRRHLCRRQFFLLFQGNSIARSNVTSSFRDPFGPLASLAWAVIYYSQTPSSTP